MTDVLVRARNYPFGMRIIDELADEVERLRAERDRHLHALHAIALGDGCYGAQALEYKNIAREAAGFPKVGGGLNVAFPFDAEVDTAFKAGDLDELERLIDTAAREKVEGYGPPQDAIRIALRRYHELYEGRSSE